MEWLAYGIPTLILLAALAYAALRAGTLSRAERVRIDAATRATQREENRRDAQNNHPSPEEDMSLQSRERMPPYLPPGEPLQPDPMLKPEPMAAPFKWSIVAGGLAILAMVIYGVAHHAPRPDAGVPFATDRGDRPPKPRPWPAVAPPRTPPAHRTLASRSSRTASGAVGGRSR